MTRGFHKIGVKMINLTIEKEKLQSMGSDFLTSIPELRNSENLEYYLEELLMFIDDVLLAVTATDSNELTYTPNLRSLINNRSLNNSNFSGSNTLRPPYNETKKEVAPQRFPFIEKVTSPLSNFSNKKD